MAEGRVSQSLCDEAMDAAQRTGVRFEEALIEGGLGEAEVLKHLAATFKTQFVSTEKLARATIDRATLAMVPRRMAEQRLVLPVLFDAKTSVLSVVTADPDDLESLKEIQLGTGVREVRPLVARPAAIEAGIAKHYAGVRGAFLVISRAKKVIEPEPEDLDFIDRSSGLDVPRRLSSPNLAVPAPAPTAAPQVIASDPSPASPAVQGDIPAEDIPGLRASSIPQTPPSPPTSPVSSRRSSHERAAPGTPPAGSSAGSARHAVMGSGDFLQVVNVLVSLLEVSRAELRSHSAHTARLVRKVYERMGLGPTETYGAVLAALLHDLGKASNYHLTPLNVSQYQGHRVAAEKVVTTPARLLESVRMPPSCLDGLAYMYEQVDGNGFPSRLKGKDIPLEARVLAICDSFSDLTTNPRNPYRRVLSHQEACEALRKHAGTVFDANLVALFEHTVLGDDIRQALLAERPRVLLVDPDAEETTVLELRLLESGFDVSIARSADAALSLLESRGGADVVIAEMDLAGTSGIELLQRLRALPGAKDLPVLVHTRHADPEDVSRAMELGASDYLVKPTASQVIAVKVQRLLDAQRQSRRGKGVTGSLSEMSLPDIVQVLHHGRKSGALRLDADGKNGEIAFQEGQIWDATFGGKRGEEAFYSMLGLTQGAFELDPEARASTRTIQSSAEMLLLEGMRRMDEGSREG